MSEGIMMILLPLGPLLWMLGGYRWKGWRRLIWPAAAGGLLLCSHVHLLNALAVMLTLYAVLVLPYGDRTPWPLRIVVFGSYGLPVCWLDWRFGLWWAVGTAIVLSLVAYLSRRYSRVTWKLWEGLVGFLQAAGLILGTLR